MKTTVGAVLVLGLVGCATPALRRGAQVEAGEFLVAVEHGQFDGHALRGRLLLSAQRGHPAIDFRSILIGGVFVDSARRCDSLKHLPLLVNDRARVGPLPSSTTLTLERGIWFGTDFDVNVLARPVRECVLIGIGLQLPTATDPDHQLRVLLRAEGERVDLLRTLNADEIKDEE